jgi:MoaA/NifB/PqqE/SkfB family radical SAM enzyme
LINARFETLSKGSLYRRAYMGLNYRLRTFAGGRLAANCRPTDIGFMMTNLCNAKCVHCDIWKNKGRDDTPTPDQYKTVLSELRSWLGPVHVFFSGGEALLRPYTTELAAHASAVGLYAEVLTHGYWPDQKPIEKLAMANPGRITVSLDGIGETHTIIRGRENFFEKTTRSLDTLKRIRSEKGLRFDIRLKTVIMEQNLHDVHNVAEYAAANGMEVFYQAVEQNYNTEEDPRWFEHSDNWPKNPSRAVAAVERLIALKRNGLPIRNSYPQLETMIPYFLNPDTIRVSVQQHTAHLKYPVCAALTNIQIQPNGDVLACYGMPPIGNIRSASIREIWRNRPQFWKGGCCLERRLSPAEAETRGLVLIGATGGHSLDRRS